MSKLIELEARVAELEKKVEILLGHISVYQPSDWGTWPDAANHTIRNLAVFDSEGYDEHGFNAFGENRNGYEIKGRDAEGYDDRGYNSDGVHISERIKEDLEAASLDEMKQRLKKIRANQTPLSKEAWEARLPPPESLVGALQDPVHKEMGEARGVRSFRQMAKTGERIEEE